MKRKLYVALVLSAVGAVALLLGFELFHSGNSITGTIASAFVPKPRDVFAKNNILVLIEGLDYDYTQADQEFSTHSRSDVLWAVNLDFATRRVYELSIPRDMIATLPNGNKAKINEAQADGGTHEAEDVVANFLGIPGFDRYVVLRINATKGLVDALGGVTLLVKTSDCLQYNTGCEGGRLDYDDDWGHLHVHLKEGSQHLDGEKAMAYMRFRHDWCSDPCRIKRQQQLLHAIINEAKNNHMQLLLHSGALIETFRTQTQTNFTSSELLSLFTYFSAGNPAIITSQVPYTTDIDLPGYGDSLVPNDSAKGELVRKMLLSASGS